MEEWKDIVGYEGLYQVSNLGNIKSFKRYIEGKLLIPKSDKDGYKEIGIRDITGKRTFKRIHRLVAEAFIPNPNKYKFINHKDNNPTNNTVDNIEWCSIEYNNKYRFTNGNACHKGEKHPMSSLTNEDVIRIAAIGNQNTHSEPIIAKLFNTTRSIVNKIRLKVRWQHILDKYPDPIVVCDVYKREGCSHVDGYLCNPKTCNMLIKYVGASGCRMSINDFKKFISNE